MMETPLLSNKDQYPSEEIIFSHLGEAKIWWQSILNHIHSQYPDFSEEWRYYADGKSWLMKVTRKSKTIFWLSIIPGGFKITFYFGDKAESAILGSTLSTDLKDIFQNGRRFGKIRAITQEVRGAREISEIKTLIELKLSIK